MKTINLLFIGNSYSRNLETLMPMLAKNLGINLNVVNFYYGGCSLNQHYEFISKKQRVYEIDVYDSNKKTWTYQTGKTVDDVINLFKWDFISLQQCSIWSGKNTKEHWGVLPKLKKLVRKLFSKNSPNFKLIWHMTWAYAEFYPLEDSFYKDIYKDIYKDQYKMYYDIVLAEKENIFLDKDFAFTLPSGHVLKELRLYFKDDKLMMSDGVHLNGKFSYFCTALAALARIAKPNKMYEKSFNLKCIKFNLNGQNVLYRFNKKEIELLNQIVKTSLKY